MLLDGNRGLCPRIPSKCAVICCFPSTLSGVQNMAPFSDCTRVLLISRRDEACQINQINKTSYGNLGRFDTVEVLSAEEQDQIDLEEIDMLPDADRGLFMLIPSRYAAIC